MPRPAKIDNEKLLQDLKDGMNNYQAARKHGVSGEAVRQHRQQFEKEGLLEPRGELAIGRRGRTARVGAIKPKQIPQNYQLGEYIRLAVREEMKAFFSAVANIDDIIAERDAYKQQATIARKTLAKITDSQKEYELLIKQGQINPPLLKRTSDLTYHIDCAPELIVPNTSPLLTISAGSFVFN